MVSVAELGGARTLLQVPLLKDNEPVDGIYRQEVRPFDDKRIALLQNFAAQASLPCGFSTSFANARGLTHSLEFAPQDRRGAGEADYPRQLTAGIAHEIRTAQFRQQLFRAVGTGRQLDRPNRPGSIKDPQRHRRTYRMLKSNLERWCSTASLQLHRQNMLLHCAKVLASTSAPILTPSSESLNLAYHGARRSNQHHAAARWRSRRWRSRTLSTGITRVLLSLISNGFYAATKREVARNL